MSFRQQLIFFAFFGMAWFLLSNAKGVPQGVTQAPGEVPNQSCATCHIPAGNYTPSIALEITDLHQSPVNRYTPGQTYNLKVKVNALNNPKSFGFQLLCSDSLTDTDKGNWLELGDKVRLQNLTIKQKPRKYLVQSAPKADGTFITKWKAPDTDIGPIKFYFAGLAVNLNGKTDGDNHVTGNLTFHSPTSHVETDYIEEVYKIYPNPTDGIIHVPTHTKNAQIIGIDGKKYNYDVNNSQLNIGNIKQGIYVVCCFDQDGHIITTKSIIKQ